MSARVGVTLVAWLSLACTSAPRDDASDASTEISTDTGSPLDVSVAETAEASIDASMPDADPAIGRGRMLFERAFTAAEGLGPVYNEVSCVTCHQQPTTGGSGDLAHPVFVEMERHGGATPEAGAPFRIGPPLYGMAALAAIPDATLMTGCGGSGRLTTTPSGHPRRFGLKDGTDSLRQFIAGAFFFELGLSNLGADTPFTDMDGVADPEISQAQIDDVLAFVQSLPAPTRVGSRPDGEAVFRSTGCTMCHSEAYGAYSDLCLHRMGSALDQGTVFSDEFALGDEWRTRPLWGLHGRTLYLHDGRASTLHDAIVTHGGEAQPFVDKFKALTPTEHDALIAFLNTL